MNSVNKIVSAQKYEIIDLFREGSFDTSYLASDQNKKKLIIRSINTTLDKDHLKETLKEAIILTRIKCDNLIQGVLKYFIESKQLFLLMDFYQVILTLKK